MASAGDMLARVDSLLKRRDTKEISSDWTRAEVQNDRATDASYAVLRARYEAYLPKQETPAQVEAKIAKMKGTEAFAAMLGGAETILDELLEKAAAVKSERNRAAVATLNAEVRRGKNYLRGEIPKLRKAARTKAAGTTEQDAVAMLEIVDDFETRVEAVADGVTRGLPPQKRKPAGGESSEAFRQEFEARKAKQDQGLDVISRGLGVLKDIGGEMTEEMRRQQPITDAIEDKLDSVNAEIRTANARLKDTVTKMRSSRKFCVDCMLICVILGVALSVYKLVA
ncbi:syntaxin of plants 71 [Ostreococcus tauri]|uniref:Syntaxin of plants 71 n=1 Tax=Ostreococcus tauri TaxID=70448 RepID=A0A1Y5IL13_OSTTA|nr:syntaxin of plants 71 [Ostreococcus tauri]